MDTKNRIVFFTNYTADDVISRNRFYNNEAALQQQGFDVTHCPLHNPATSKAWYEKGIQPNEFATFFARLRRRYQLFLHRENTIAVVELPLLPNASFPFQKKWFDKQKKVIIDIRNSRAKDESPVQETAPLADAVVTNTPNITRQLLPLAKEIIEIPFSISVKEYEATKAAQLPEERSPFRIGWLGNEVTSSWFLLLKDCLFQLHELYNIQLVLIGFDKAKESELKGLPFVNHSRDEATDISLLKACDVAVLPLPDGFSNFPFEMIQYMACGLPLVAASCEVSIAINHRNDNFFARSTFEWYSGLAAMIQNRDYYKQVGEKNIAIARDFYSTDKTQKDYLSFVLNITYEV